MKAIVQKVTTAKITVGEEEVCSIKTGLCVFVGFSKHDTVRDVDYMVNKVLDCRLFDDETGKRWQKSVRQTGNEILCVSQFSLYNKLKGNMPDFHEAMQGEQAHDLYKSFLQKLANNYSEEEKIKDGRFGVKRIVHIQNDGPVIISLESPVSCKNKQDT